MAFKFQLHQPRTIEEAAYLLNQYGDDAKVLAGGTELVITMKRGLIPVDHLIHLGHIPDLNWIRFDETKKKLHVGPGVTHRMLETSPLIARTFPLLQAVEHEVANVRVRNRGTLAGNLCFADPHSDPGILLVAHGARLRAQGVGGTRWISIDDFLVDYYQTSLRAEELLVEIEIPQGDDPTYGAYLRLSPRVRPSIGICVLLTLDSDRTIIRKARIALGCVVPRPIRIPNGEMMLEGKSLQQSRTCIEDIAEEAKHLSTPIADLNGSVAYKREMVRVYTRRAVNHVLDQVGKD